MKLSFVYIITNKNNTLLYTGVTSNLVRRIHQHKTGFYQTSFSKRYNCHKLVYYEIFTDIRVAIRREKQLKAGNRRRKVELIEKENGDWRDLAKDWVL